MTRMRRPGGRRLIQRPLPELKKLRDEQVDIIKYDAGCIALPGAVEIEILLGGKDCRLSLLANEAGEGGMVISYNDTTKEICVDRSGMKRRFNENQGEARTRKLDGLSRLKIYIDSSSVEIFVNDGDAVFTSRVFPTEEERYMKLEAPEAFVSLWTLKPAVKEHFVI